MSLVTVEERIEVLLSGSRHHNDPLCQACTELLAEHKKLHRRLDRIGRISDTYQAQLRDAKNELERTKVQLEETLKDLQTSYWHLKKIHEVLPVCLQCGKVKSVSGAWEPVLDFLRKNSQFLSHGYCPDCLPQVLETWREQLGAKRPTDR